MTASFHLQCSVANVQVTPGGLNGSLKTPPAKQALLNKSHGSQDKPQLLGCDSAVHEGLIGGRQQLESC